MIINRAALSIELVSLGVPMGFHAAFINQALQVFSAEIFVGTSASRGPEGVEVSTKRGGCNQRLPPCCGPFLVNFCDLSEFCG